MVVRNLSWQILCVGLVAAVLTACSSSGDDDDDGGTPVPPEPIPELPALALEPAFPSLSFTSPVALLQAPGNINRWYVVEKPGTVRAFPNDAAASGTDLFVDIRDRVDDGFGEAGLLGMAFHPGYPGVPYVYLSYTASGPSGATPLVSRISRFEAVANGATLVPASETVLLTVPQHAGNHNGGHLAFGPDGYLYAGFGDGGGGGDPEDNGQDTGNVLGSIVRIDVDGGSPYAIPPANPFATNAVCAAGVTTTDEECPEIFAWGLRNPWRFSFDTDTGELWAGDVGQGSWEEIDRIVVGENYGWNVREGAHCFDPPSACDDDFAEPVAEYDHSLGQSVTGGYVSRGPAIPELDGYYLFGDFVSGRLFVVPGDAQPTVAPEVLHDSEARIASFATDRDGDLYLLDYASGTVQRIIVAP